MSMTKKDKALMVTILTVALIHIPQMSLTPGIARMKTDAYPEYTLLAIQSAVTLPCLVSVVSCVVAAMLIRYGKLSRRSAVIIGLALFGCAGIFTVLFHTQFWQVIVAGLLLGFGTGMIVTNITSIMIDSFDDSHRKVASGLQGSFVSLGGIIQSFFAGLLVTVVWYGGYIMLLLAIPICILCIFTLPAQKKYKDIPTGKFTDMPSDVMFFSIFGALLFVMTFAVLGNNISSHFQASGIENYSAMAGIGISVNLLGAVIMGLFFNKLSQRFGDYLIFIAYVMLAVGYALLAFFTSSMILMLLGSFIAGMSLTLATPQGIISLSRYVTPANSFFATMLFNGIMNGIAGFISAPVYTGISQMISKDDTVLTFNFTAICSIGIGVAFLIFTLHRIKKGKVWR